MTKQKLPCAGDFPHILCKWFSAHQRDLPWRRDKEPYHVWLSEIMLQQTRVEAVKPYYLRFLERLPDIRALCECEQDELMKLWEGLGYYSRARNLQKAAKQITEQFGGVFPRTYKEIRSLSGIGDYTAGAVASICFDLPEPAVDGNVLRVITRILADGRCTDEPAVKKDIRDMLRKVYVQFTDGSCGQLTQAIMELGATVCVPNGQPRCGECPMQMYCAAFRMNRISDYPVRKEKKARKTEYYTVYILQCGDKIAVRKRPDNGLLAGLWELPHLDGERTAQQAVTDAEIWKAGAAELLSLRKRSHIFTHITWHMTCVHITVTRKPDCFTWVTAAQLAEKTALPTAFRICLPEDMQSKI
ncbi:MAG: A/G-specific adenine glycosylase [Oscillospiraceae bacterium]|nr:A/G-specific adenine glycosylase [Oscillospiraceae bacterium]